MRHFHLTKQQYFCPTINTEKLWSLVTEQVCVCVSTFCFRWRAGVVQCIGVGAVCFGCVVACRLCFPCCLLPSRPTSPLN